MSFLDDAAIGMGGGGGDTHAQLLAQWSKLRESFTSAAPVIQQLIDGRGVPKDHTVRLFSFQSNDDVSFVNGDVRVASGPRVRRGSCLPGRGRGFSCLARSAHPPPQLSMRCGTVVSSPTSTQTTAVHSPSPSHSVRLVRPFVLLAFSQHPS